MKYLLYSILIFLVVLIQYTIIPAAFPDIFLNLPLIFILVFTFFLNYYEAVTFSFAAGFILDFFVFGPFGINIIAFPIIVFLTEIIISKLRKINALTVFFTGLFSLVFYNFLFFLLNYIFKFFDFSYYQFSQGIFFRKEFLFSILINNILFLVFYFIFKRFSR